MVTNEPINRLEGNIEQADLEAANAAEYRQALAILKAVDAGPIWPTPIEYDPEKVTEGIRTRRSRLAERAFRELPDDADPWDILDRIEARHVNNLAPLPDLVTKRLRPVVGNSNGILVSDDFCIADCTEDDLRTLYVDEFRKMEDAYGKLHEFRVMQLGLNKETNPDGSKGFFIGQIYA